MSTFTNFTITISFANFSTENWKTLVKNSTNPKNTCYEHRVELQLLLAMV